MQQQSADIGNLQKALAEAQGEFTPVPKNKTAKVKSQRTGGEYEYKYADLADIFAMALPVLSKHGLAISQPNLLVDGRLRVCTKLMHASGEWMMSDGIALSESGDPQAFGTGSSYYRRYDACSILAISPDEDTDAQHTSTQMIQQPQRTTERRPKPVPPAAPAPTPAEKPPAEKSEAEKYLEDRDKITAEIMALGSPVAELAEVRNRLFPGHKNSRTLSIDQLREFQAELVRKKKAAEPVRIPDEPQPSTSLPDVPPDVMAMFEDGTVTTASQLPARARQIGKTKAHELHRIMGARKVHTETELLEHILQPLHIEHLSELPEDLYAQVALWVEGKA